VSRIVSLLPAATEIAGALGLMEEIVGVSHECDFPKEANERPRVTHCPIHQSGLTSGEVDEWVRRTLRENGTIYTIDEPLLRDLRQDVILTQKLCDVCAVGYDTVARLAETLPGAPRVVNLEPSSLTEIFENIRRKYWQGCRPALRPCVAEPRKSVNVRVAFSWSGSIRFSVRATGDRNWWRLPADSIRWDANTSARCKFRGKM